MCQKHQFLLVNQLNYSEDDPWRALLVVSQITLLQAVTCDPKTHEKIGKDITNISTLGCLACYKPDAFGEIVDAGSKGGIAAIKELGEKWVTDTNKKNSEANTNHH